MKISYLMNSYVFLEVYSKIEDGELKIDEVKINSILRYLNNEEKEKIYENIKCLASEISKINLNNKDGSGDVFKSIIAKQVDVYPVESFNIHVSEAIGASIDEIERVKSMVFLCCSNISLIINRNAVEIEREIEKIMINVRKFTLAEDNERVLDIMVRDDEEAENDLILSVNINNDLLSIEEDADTSLIASEVISIVNELSQYIKEDVVSLLVEDECMLRITKRNTLVDVKYNEAILNEVKYDKLDIVKSMSANLLNVLYNK